MQPVNHPIEPEELMAYLDGELPADRAVNAAAHLDQCPECRELAADLRHVSRSLAEWEIEPAGPMLSRPHMPPAEVEKPRRAGFGLPRWAWAAGLVCALGLAVLIRQSISPAPTVIDRLTAMDRPLKSPGAAFNSESPLPPQATPGPAPATPQDALESGSIVNGPMIARTAELQITSRDFGHVRERLDAILKRHHGYFGELAVTTPAGAGRTLQGKLQLPADQLDSAMGEIKQIGHVDSESLSGEDVSAQYIDLDARLSNARHTEQRIIDVLRDRTGKLSDIIEAERELGRVRGQIEQMEAEKRAMLKRVDYSTLALTVNEEYKAQLQVSDSLPTRFRNAAVSGLRSMAASLVAVVLFLMSAAPVVLLWAAILFFPVRYGWRRWRRG